MAVTLPTTGAGVYTIEQINPALELYSADTTVTEEDGVWTKSKTYNLNETEANEPYQFLLGDKTGNVVIKLYKSGVLVGTVNIANNLTFNEFVA